MTFNWKIEVRDASLKRVGQLDDYASLDMSLKFNDVSTWQITVDRRSPLAYALTQPGAGIVVSRAGTTILSGDWKQKSRRKNESGDQLTVSGVDDTVWLKRRLAHPQPLSTAPPYSTTAEDVRTNFASNIMRQFVGVNLAQDGATPAIVPRIKVGLTRALDISYGPIITGRGRWQNLLVLLQELAVSGAVNGIPVGFRVVQIGNGLQYQGFAPVDRTATAVFSEGFGNLSEFTYGLDAPEATYWYVGGQGDGTARTVYEQPDSPAVALWGRIEAELVNASTAANVGELAQAAEKAKAEQTAKVSLSVTPIDTDRLAFGVHYGLGDRVTVVVDAIVKPGDPPAVDKIQDVLRECQIKLTPEGSTITPVIGSEGASASPLKIVRFAQGLAKRLVNIERR